MKAISGILTALLTMLFLISSANAAAYFTGTLNSAQEVPTNASTATGFGRVTLNDAETQITVSLTFSGLSSNQTASHIHGAAPLGVNAPVIFNIGSTGMTSGSFVDLFFNVTPAQVRQLKTGQFYFNVHSANFPGGEIRGQILRRRSTVLDFDGDSKTDYAVVRNDATANSLTWFINNSSNNSLSAPQFGASGDFSQTRLLAGDFDGDGKDDVTVWRPASSGNAAFFILLSATNTFRAVPFGQSGDDPRMIGDYDGDGRTDPAVWRAGAQATLFYTPSANNPSNLFVGLPWGTTGDFPSPGDFDGDGKADICVQRAVSGAGVFYCLNSNTGFKTFQWGASSDLVAPGDYDGDGKTDITVVRTVGSNRVWFPLYSSNPVFTSISWGTNAAVRAQGDYDGDGKTDVAVWQNSAGSTTQRQYAVLPSDGSVPVIADWGLSTDISVNGYNVR